MKKFIFSIVMASIFLVSTSVYAGEIQVNEIRNSQSNVTANYNVDNSLVALAPLPPLTKKVTVSRVYYFCDWPSSIEYSEGGYSGTLYVGEVRYYTSEFPHWQHYFSQELFLCLVS